MDAGVAFVFGVVFWAAVDEAAAEGLDFAGEVFPVVLPLLPFLVVDDFALVAVDFALVVGDFARVATDLDLGAALAAFWTAEFAFF